MSNTTDQAMNMQEIKLEIEVLKMCDKENQISITEYARQLLERVEDRHDRKGQQLASWVWYTTYKLTRQHYEAYNKGVCNQDNLLDTVEEVMEDCLLYPSFLQEFASVLPNKLILTRIISRIARRRCIDILRAKHRSIVERSSTLTDLLENVEYLSDSSTDEVSTLQDEIMQSEQAEYNEADFLASLPSLVASLSPKMRDLLTLMLLGGTQDHIREQLGIGTAGLYIMQDELRRVVEDWCRTGEASAKYDSRHTDRLQISIGEAIQAGLTV